MDSGSDKSASRGSNSGDTEKILGSDCSDQVQNMCILDTIVQSIWVAVPIAEGGVAWESDPSSTEIPLESPVSKRLAARQSRKDQLSKNAAKVARKIQKMAAAKRAAKLFVMAMVATKQVE
jgi:hypothetical protein